MISTWCIPTRTLVKTGNSLNDEQELPDWMNTQEMRQAMGTLRQFSEKDKNYFAYQARQNYLRQQMSVYGELDATKLREQQVIAERDALALREQQALEEIEKLKALLASKQS
jgi:hypothetical protein